VEASGDGMAEPGRADEPNVHQKLLIVDLSFGGLSNRRQSLMLAAAAAKLIGWSTLPSS